MIALRLPQKSREMQSGCKSLQKAAALVTVLQMACSGHWHPLCSEPKILVQSYYLVCVPYRPLNSLSCVLLQSHGKKELFTEEMSSTSVRKEPTS